MQRLKVRTFFLKCAGIKQLHLFDLPLKTLAPTYCNEKDEEWFEEQAWNERNKHEAMTSKEVQPINEHTQIQWTKLTSGTRPTRVISGTYMATNLGGPLPNPL